MDKVSGSHQPGIRGNLASRTLDRFLCPHCALEEYWGCIRHVSKFRHCICGTSDRCIWSNYLLFSQDTKARNFIERLSQGYVTDFISIDSFAVFNVADASISIGTAILAISLFQRERKEKIVESPPADDEASSTQEVMHSQLPEDVEGE
jgi:hypothetical protein